jgi:hypothetical protein
MSIQSAPMVMRSVYLPEDMDLQLRQIGFILRRSKADLIRAFVSSGLSALPQNLNKASRSERARVVRQIFGDSVPDSTRERLAFEADTERVSQNASEPSRRQVRDAAE